MCTDRLDWYRSESPFQLAVQYYVHKYIIEYGPFTFKGIKFCQDYINAALVHLPTSPLSRFTDRLLRSFLCVLDIEADAIYEIVPLQKYVVPTMAQINQMIDPNTNYSIQSVALEFGHQTALLCFVLFQQMVTYIQQQSSTPMIVSHIIDETYVTTSQMPFGKMVAYSFRVLTDDPNFTLDIKTLENALRWNYHTLDYNTWGQNFATWLKGDTVRQAIFLGTDPYNNQNLKTIANVGSQLFDTISSVYATIYKIGNNKRTNNEAAPNGTLNEMYDSLIKFKFYGIYDPFFAITRHWNNKGNSMENLAMTMFDDHQHELLWFTAYICFHGSYQGSALPNIRTI